MEISCSSGNYEILSGGYLFLFENEPLIIDIAVKSGSVVSVEFKFLNDDTNERTIQSNVLDDKVVFTCVNFNSAGTGFSHPIELAVIDGRKISLTRCVRLF